MRCAFPTKAFSYVNVTNMNRPRCWSGAGKRREGIQKKASAASACTGPCKSSSHPIVPPSMPFSHSHSITRLSDLHSIFHETEIEYDIVHVMESWCHSTLTKDVRSREVTSRVDGKWDLYETGASCGRLVLAIIFSNRSTPITHITTNPA